MGVFRSLVLRWFKLSRPAAVTSASKPMATPFSVAMQTGGYIEVSDQLRRELRVAMCPICTAASAASSYSGAARCPHTYQYRCD